MKRKLTFQFLFWDIIVIYIVQAVFFGVNILSVRKSFSFSKSFYNLSFEPSSVLSDYEHKLANGKEFNLKGVDIKKLTDNDIWLQVLNSSSKEIYSINKPKEIPKEYLAGDLIRYSQNEWTMPRAATLYSKTFDKNGGKYSLILGFPPEHVLTYSIMFTEESKRFYIGLIILGAILTIVAGYLFSRKLAAPVADIVADIKMLSQGQYEVKDIKKSEIYREVNENIKVLSEALKKNEEERKEMEKIKEQWIANMAHDLKTPLASVNGYSQFLIDEEYELNDSDVKRYGKIISDKTKYIEELINDLSLIYKFKNKVVPLNFKKENIVEVVREIVIDILNNPTYSDSNINIDYSSEEIYINCDKKYIRRALNNFIFNALVHNPKDTEINIDVSLNENYEVFIEIKDNGNGIKEEELNHLFDRYYRATNTGESHKGSGLGMAIGKEIIDMHGGEIKVSSKISEGTSISIKFLEK